MRGLFIMGVVGTASLAHAVPALAQAGTPLPAPDSLALLALGLAGLIFGRRFARRRDDDDRS